MEQPYSPGNTVKSDNVDAAHMTVKSMCTREESSQQHVEQLFEQSRQHPPANLRDAVASAVVEDQRMRERNAKSLIVIGFTSTSGSDSGCTSQDDLNSFCELCESELNLSRVKPKYCKRLGSAGSGKILPLLVAFETAEQVNEILSHAKKLRGSINVTVRRNVYINRNLTKLEARMAYEQRCRRRQRRRPNVDHEYQPPDPPDLPLQQEATMSTEGSMSTSE